MGKKKGKSKSDQDDAGKKPPPATSGPIKPTLVDVSQKGGGDAPQPSTSEVKPPTKQKQQPKAAKQEKSEEKSQPKEKHQKAKPESKPQQQKLEPKSQEPAKPDMSVSPQPQSAVQKKKSFEQRVQSKSEEFKQPKASGSKKDSFKSGAGGDSVDQIRNVLEKLKLDLNFQAVANRTSNKGGTRGRPLKLETNYLELKLNQMCPIGYHYDVEFEPEKAPKKFYLIAVSLFLAKHFPGKYPSFDGRKNLYSSTLLFPKSKKCLEDSEIKVTAPYEREKTFNVKIQLVNEIDLRELITYMKGDNGMKRPQTAIQCLDVVFRQASTADFVRVGRSFFTNPERVIKLSGGMELWHGLFQSAVIGSKPFLNIDVAHKAFPIEQPVLDLIQELSTFGNNPVDPSILHRDLHPSVLRTLSSFIRGLKVKFQLPNDPAATRIFKVNDVVQPPGRAVFKKDGEDTTVLEYFRQEKRYNIRFPNLPCLHLGPREKHNFYPLELCTIMPGQAVNRKLNDEQTRQMIRNSATSTYIRKDKIMSNLNKLQYNRCPCIREFGVEVDTKFTDINARVIDPPDLRYASSMPVKPRDGQWRAMDFFVPCKILNWCILNLDNRTRNEQLLDFENQVKTCGQRLKMEIKKVNLTQTLQYGARDHDIVKFIEQCKHQKVELIFVVLPGGSSCSEAYNKIKQIAELQIGILTQCIQSKTMYRMNQSTVGNILLKVNAKLNGKNHIWYAPPPIFAEKKDIMVVGADVTHPSPEQKNIPSVAAVAASCDLTAIQYNFRWRLQDPTMEIIEDLETIMIEQLKCFLKKTGKTPKCILFFRDGVSEGQFKQVRDQEIQAIQSACSKLSASYKPPITFLVVQKRHHTRFFPKDRNDGDKNGNVPPGTCVDTTITYPNKMDFYLCSHASLQGVSRPTRYCVLLDENNLNEDHLEQLTYYLCHVFTRCTRAVSYPAPTYYAHLAASRAKTYISGKNIDMSSLRMEQSKYVIKDEICQEKPMFFV